MKPHERERLTALLGPRLDKRFCYSRKDGLHEPQPKQREFLDLDDYEVLYGGARGGGKSDAMLMAALQYVDLPHYRALILRRNDKDFHKSDSILTRAKEWWLPTKRTGVVFSANDARFTFPSGSTCEFAHCNNLGDEERHLGAAWQFVGLEELTQFAPTQYVFMFSCLRGTDIVGQEPIPLRMRATSNPGGSWNNWYRERFMSINYAKQFLDDNHSPTFAQTIPTTVGSYRRVFVPAKVKDNFKMRQDEYIMGLDQLDPVMREQHKAGNWLISAAGRFRPEWFHRYSIDAAHPSLPQAGYIHILDQHGNRRETIHERQCERFITVDPAGTEAEMKGKAKGKQPCWGVISTWLTYGQYLFWWSIRREQMEFPEFLAAIKEVHHEQQRCPIWVERDGLGKSYYTQLDRDRFPVYALDSGGKDKLTRSATAQNEAKAERILLPRYAPWLDVCEAELFAWQGTSNEPCDQIDTLSYAAKLKTEGTIGGAIVIQM